MTRVVVIFLVIFFFSCTVRDRIPSNILPPDKMEVMLWDFIRADQFNQDYIFNHDTLANRKDTSVKSYLKILAIHRVRQEDFRKSFYYYRAHPQFFRTIMDSISKRNEFLLDPSVPLNIEDTLSSGATPVPLQ